MLSLIQLSVVHPCPYGRVEVSPKPPGTKVTHPDLHLPGLGFGGSDLVLDTKVGSPLLRSLTVEESERASHTAFAGVADRFLTKVIGRPARGAAGAPAFSHATGLGLLSAKRGDYAGALARGHEVIAVIHEVFGGAHPAATRLLTRAVKAYAQRLDGRADGHRGKAFRAYHSAQMSMASAKGLASELRRGCAIVSARARAAVAA